MQGTHPRARTLRGAGEIVAEEKAAFAAIRIEDLKHPHIRMPRSDALLFLEADAEQAACHVKSGFDDFFELKIRLQFRLIEGEAFGTQLFSIEAPIPWRNLVIAAIGCDQALQFDFFFMGLGARLVPDGFQQVHDRLWRLGHGVVELVGGKVGVAEQMCLALAQFHHFAHDVTIVAFATVLAALCPGIERLFAQFTIFGEGKEWLDN